MESRIEKLALARKKLKDHQEKKLIVKDIDTKNIEYEDAANATDTNNEHKNMSACYSINTKDLADNIPRENNNEIKYEDNFSKSYITKSHEQTAGIPFTRTELSLQEELMIKENKLISLSEERVKLSEQLEFTQTMLISKDTEMKSLHYQIKHLEDQNNAFQLRIQQLTDGFDNSSSENINKDVDNAISKKKNALEEQLQLLQKERDQITMHYEHYVAEINEQLKSTLTKNDQLSYEVQNLMSRETSLIDQISQLEIRLQNIQRNDVIIKNEDNNTELQELKQKNEEIEGKFKQLQGLYQESLNKLTQVESEVQYLKESNHGQEIESVSVSKLSADIESDKIAARRATEQNVKLKDDLQELENAFVKMSRDKLELTEKLSAEKYLNRELTIKLSENEEKLRTTQIALNAKDSEMIRLLNYCCDLEKKIAAITPKEDKSSDIDEQTQSEDTNECLQNEKHDNEIISHQHCDKSACSDLSDNKICSGDSSNMPREDAMLKLQERFFKIMEEVANLSDEKHQLEHIVTQLQNETDTICEYVALYQQQRSLLKKRDEERSAQIKAFQTECSNLRAQLSQLSELIVKLTEDEHLSAYFQSDARRNEIANTLELLKNLRENVIINSDSHCTQLNNFYPCSCCSGKLIDV